MRRARSVTAAVFACAVLVLLPACASLPRLAEKERWDEVIERAGKRRRPPRGKAARAYARALEHKGRFEQARAVLLLDYRHGGKIASLLELAALERRRGLLGSAAAHYARAIDLDAKLAARDPAACSMMKDRARAFAGEQAASAAAADLDRAERVCAPPRDPKARASWTELRGRVDQAAAEQTRRRVAATRCATPESDCAEPDPAARAAKLHEAIAAAEAKGPRALRAAAARLRVALTAEQIVMLLRRDLEGALGPAIVGDDEVRDWIGDKRWTDLAPVVMSQDATTAGYVQLRLAGVLADLPAASRPMRGIGEADVWVARALEQAGAFDWRLLAWQGDLASAETALATRLRPGSSGVGGNGPSVPSHWATRVALDDASVPALLAVARLRHAAGQHDVALTIARDIAARGDDVADIDAAIANEAAWHLAWGRPWQALALSSARASVRTDAVAAAAATAILLARAFCGGVCDEDEDAAVVARVLDDAWVQDESARLHERALRQSTGARPAGTCPTLAELVAPDASGSLADALRLAAIDVDGPQAIAAYATAVESDLTLACAARWVLPLWSAAEATTTADAVTERLAHGGTPEAAGTLAAQSGIAMIAGRMPDAELLAVAAAGASLDPRAQWIDIGRMADANGRRDLELLAGRHALLNTPALQDRGIRRAMMLERLGDLARDSADATTPAGGEAIARELSQYLLDLTPDERWAERERLVERLGDETWVDADARAKLRAVLWPTQDLLDAHPIARRRLDRDAGDREPPPFDAAALALWAQAGHPLPLPTCTFGDPTRLQAARVAVARHGKQWPRRWRTAIGLAVVGSDDARADALAVLLAMSEGAARHAIVDLVVATPAAVDPTSEGPRAVAIVDREDRLVRLVFGLRPRHWPDPDPEAPS